MKSVVVSDLVKRFGSVTALDTVNLHVEPGELFFFLGPSGCGKTTLLRSIAGFYEPESGSIAIGDRDVTRTPAHKREAGMVFQNYALFPHLTVFENVAFGLKQRKWSTDKIATAVSEALRQVRLEAYTERKPAALSGGQQQRVALARALVFRPGILLLDEPLSNLDAALRNAMRTEIRSICKQAGMTSIYVTHDQKEALAIADRIAVMHLGKIEQVGAPLEIYKRPRSRFVAEFVGSGNFLSGSVLHAVGPSILVKTPLGDLAGTASNSDFEPEPGAPVDILIRPESIQTGLMPPEENAFPLKIERVTFLGEAAQVEARSGDEVIEFLEFNPHQSADARVGEKCHAWVDSDDVVVIPQS
ncbi:MAG: ABC transporter ATP-binding protein [Opitutales bacterium]|nr:ABC transporter ATP-binding protein [Opitutales bacterium]NRA28141.1 ABC transporter ATP-binding protein [Opitutales bacterium]